MEIKTQAPSIPAPKVDLVKEFPKKNWKPTVFMALGAFLVVALGVGSGYLISGKSFGTNKNTAAPGIKESATEAGLENESQFKDTAEGVLETGGVDGEGTHHLVREGGESKYVYLTSTVIDLESFVGKRVQLWGETIAAKKAGWLMDVGKIKVIE